jgi:ubiquinone/menaquinone biosynthesis C-methylase UbiE
MSAKRGTTGTPASKCAADAPSYLLGHSEREMERLDRQARLIDPMTRRFFFAAGIGPGMRVLDVGSGAGNTATLAAELVGPAGEVVGVDRAPAALATARARVKALGLRNVTFIEGEPGAISIDRSFDAALGRYVLMFQREPAALVRNVAAHVKPGGPIVFHEPDWDGVRSHPSAPVYMEACRWIVRTVELTGNRARMGAELYETFLAAGLPPPTMGIDALIGGGEQGMEAAILIADIVETMVPTIEAAGVATAAEIALPTLKERMRREIEAGCVLFGRSEIGAWSRVGG